MATRSMFVLFSAVALSACAVNGEQAGTPTPTTSAAPVDAPVVLTVGGYGGTRCDFTLYARYPEGIAQHTVPIEFALKSLDSNFTHDSGLYVELPMTGVDWTERTPAGLLTAITGGSAEESCERLKAEVAVGACYKGNCPRYEVDANSAVAVALR